MDPSVRTAVIAFGSIVNNLYSPVYGKTLEVELPFVYPNIDKLSLPIRMSRLSSAGEPERRFTVVVDPHATDEHVAVAKSKKRTFAGAVINLKEREGTSKQNICFITRSNLNGLTHPSIPPRNFESRVCVGYVGRISGSDAEFKLKRSQAEKIVKWLQSSGYDAVIWTGLPPNVPTVEGASGQRGREIIQPMLNDVVLFRNTKVYIEKMPEAFRSELQKKILACSSQAALACI